MAFLLWPQDRPTSVYFPCPHFFGATVTSPWITADTSPLAGSPSRRSGGQREEEGGVGVMVHLAPSSRAGCALAPFYTSMTESSFCPRAFALAPSFWNAPFLAGSFHLSVNSVATDGAGKQGGKGRFGQEKQELPFSPMHLRAEWTSWGMSSWRLELSTWSYDKESE